MDDNDTTDTPAAALGTLRATLDRIRAAYSGKCTYALTDLASGGHIGADEGDVMPTASLIKVPIMVALYQAIEDGAVGGLEDRIVLSDEHRCLGSRRAPAVAVRRGDERARCGRLMIIISDNVATDMMIDHVGIERINETMRRFGLEQTTLFRRLGDRGAGLDARKMSVSTAGEMARLLTLIAGHEAVSAEASKTSFGSCGARTTATSSPACCPGTR